MANDVAVRELALLQQYNSKLSAGFLAKVQSEISRICRKLENQIEKSVEEERQVAYRAQNAIDDIHFTVNRINDIKNRHNLGDYDRDICDMDMYSRRQTARELEAQLEQFKKGHQQLRMELEGTITQLKTFGQTIESQVNSASQNLKSQISVLEKYKETQA